MIRYKQGISGSTIKIIAMVIMIIDHIGMAFVWRFNDMGYIGTESYDTWYFIYCSMRNIGRTSFPLFCFLLVEGLWHTSNKIKYATRLFLFALLSQIPFHYAFLNLTSNRNTFFTLFIGFISIWAMDEWKQFIKRKTGTRNKENIILTFLGQGLLVVAGCTLAEWLNTDYGCSGILLICIFYLLHENRIFACVIGYISFLWEAFCLPAFVLIWFYNGKRGIGLKYFFYLVYPVHLIILYVMWRYLLM